MRTNHRVRTMMIFVLSILSMQLTAQFSFGAQLLQRGEFRHGYGKLISGESDPAGFISERFRLQGTYRFDKVVLYTGIQDVRTWGNTSQGNITDGLLSVHEAWGEIFFDSCWSLKVGRQELLYDNVRFLGTSDWNMQARSHDFALVKFERKKEKLHFGFGFNQDGEALSGNILTVPGQYKTAQFLRYENEFGKFSFSVLGWNNGRQYTVLDTNNVITDQGVRFMQTFGISSVKYQLKNTSFSGFFYYQMGQDVKNKDMNAYDVGVQISHLFHANEEKRNQIRATIGGEILSGTDGNYTGNANNSFAPLFGTNHVHNGYMDMFYVGGRNENSTGLIDAMLLLKYEYSPKCFVSLNGHYFMTAADYYSAGVKLSSPLGIEADLSMGYVLTKSVSFQAGYSQFIAEETMEKMQGTVNPDTNQSWAYIMIIVRPDTDKKFVGLMF